MSVSINQTGYFPDGLKQAAYASPETGPFAWKLVEAATGKQVADGQTGEVIADKLTERQVHLIDFSDVRTPGSYRLVVDGVESPPFDVKAGLYSRLKIDALEYFYLNRSGIELKPEFAGPEWARPAGHLSDSQITAFRGNDANGRRWDGCDYTLDVSKGWYDAGDYGKYVVNGGITVWTLMNLYERNPRGFSDHSLSIPENQNGIPDILDEVRWEMEFLLNMQIPDGKPLAGMAFHKIHDLEWAGVPEMPPTAYDNNNDFKAVGMGRYAFEPTTAATLNLAAAAAQCARLWSAFDAPFSHRCLVAAETAWQAAKAHPDMLAGHVPGSGGGDYADSVVDDEFYWAAAELFITTGKDVYHEAVIHSPYFESFPGLEADKTSAMDWEHTAALGTISLAMVPSRLQDDQIAALRRQIVCTADRYQSIIREQGYRVPLQAEGYKWGSNSIVMNNALILALAYDFTNQRDYLDGVVHCMDYILGVNALNKCFVAGYGSNPMQHPHHRFWGNDPGAGFPPPPPGALAGGPNAIADDPGATREKLREKPIAMRYVDAIDSYSTNEVAINWNAVLSWVTAFLDEQFNQNAHSR